MSKPSKSDLNKAEFDQSFTEQTELLFEELSFAIQWQRPSILLVFYESEHIRDKAEFALEKRMAEIGQKVVQIKVDEKHFDIPQLLSQRQDRGQAVYFISGFSSGGGRASANDCRPVRVE